MIKIYELSSKKKPLYDIKTDYLHDWDEYPSEYEIVEIQTNESGEWVDEESVISFPIDDIQEPINWIKNHGNNFAYDSYYDVANDKEVYVNNIKKENIVVEAENYYELGNIFYVVLPNGELDCDEAFATPEEAIEYAQELVEYMDDEIDYVEIASYNKTIDDIDEYIDTIRGN